MKHYVGLDVSTKKTNVCIINENNEIVYRGIVKTEPKDIAECLIKTQTNIARIGIEASSLTTWLVTGLKNLGLPSICVDSRKMSAFIALEINKNDDNDAEVIANAMRCGAYREVYCKSIESIDKLNILGARSCLVRQRTTITNTIRGLLKSYGIRIKKNEQISFPEAIQNAIGGLTEYVKNAIESLLSTFKTLQIETTRLDKEVNKLIKTDNVVQKFCDIPGIGPITALRFRAEIDDPKRFKNARACAANLGLTPKETSSGDITKLGRISKQGCSELRQLLTECGQSVLTTTKKWNKLKVWGTKIMNKKGLKKAKVAVARKLAVILYSMWVTGTGFIPGEVDDKVIAKLTKAKEDAKKKRKRKSKQNEPAASIS